MIIHDTYHNGAGLRPGSAGTCIRDSLFSEYKHSCFHYFNNRCNTE